MKLTCFQNELWMLDNFILSSMKNSLMFEMGIILVDAQLYLENVDT